MILSEILNRGIQLDLHEAIAVVRDVIDRLMTAGHQGVPQVFEIDVLPQGTVELRGWALGGEDFDIRLGNLLTELMNPAGPPVPLRAVLDVRHSSLQELSAALGYFERPNRSATLQDLYRRASGSDFAPEADALTATLRSAPADPKLTHVHRGGDPAGQRQKLLMAAGILGAVALGGVLIVLIARFTEGTAAEASLSGLTGAVGEAVSSLSQRVGLSDPKPAPVQASEPSAVVVPVRAAAPPPTRGRPAGGKPGTPVASAGATSPAPEEGKEIAAELRTVYASDPAVAASLATPVLATYTDGSPGVVPPVALRPHLPSELPEGLNDREIGRVELTIGVDGQVEVARIVGTPPSIHESMLLSAAKAWRFRPATKDGVPVKYRTVIAVARGPK